MEHVPLGAQQAPVGQLDTMQTAPRVNCPAPKHVMNVPMTHGPELRQHAPGHWKAENWHVVPLPR